VLHFKYGLWYFLQILVLPRKNFSCDKTLQLICHNVSDGEKRFLASAPHARSFVPLGHDDFKSVDSLDDGGSDVLNGLFGDDQDRVGLGLNLFFRRKRGQRPCRNGGNAGPSFGQAIVDAGLWAML
jgi:hypothetical protein